MKYRFIEAHRAAYPVERLCRVLAVSRSSYYAWCKRRPSARQQQDAVLSEQIQRYHRHSRATYGSRRLSQALRTAGVVCSRARVARLMRQHGLETRIRRAYRVTTRPNPRLPVAPNRLDRQFTATRPNEKWVADFTYIRTQQGWLYLATVLDVFSRQIVGWSMSHRSQTELVENALRMALARRCPSAGLLHHSDRGSQYTSGDYQKLLAQHHIEVSMSRTGQPYDNAMAESFFATLKTECVTYRFATRAEARATVFDYIEVWYNRQRLHSSLGYLSPAAFERLYAA